MQKARGNQRELAREKAAKKNAKAGGNKKDDGLTPLQRKERDAKALAEKQARKAAEKEAAAGKQTHPH